MTFNEFYEKYLSEVDKINSAGNESVEKIVPLLDSEIVHIFLSTYVILTNMREKLDRKARFGAVYHDVDEFYPDND